MTLHARCAVLLVLLGGVLAAAPAAAAPDLAAARAALAGNWSGKLEYLDYGANRWFGLPVTVTIEDQGDGATLIRRADFDDGPRFGIVRITTVELFDAAKATVAVGSFRKGRAAEITSYSVRFATPPRDRTRWTIVEEASGTDDNRPATIRLTTVRDGDAVETLKEVDFLDDTASTWLTRNRTRLTRQGDLK